MVEVHPGLAPGHHDDAGAVEVLWPGGPEDVRLAELGVGVGEYRADLPADRWRCLTGRGLAGRCRRRGRWRLLRPGRRRGRLRGRLGSRRPGLLLLLASQIVLLLLQRGDLRLDARLAGGEVALLCRLPGDQAVEARLLVLEPFPGRGQRRDV